MTFIPPAGLSFSAITRPQNSSTQKPLLQFGSELSELRDQYELQYKAKQKEEIAAKELAEAKGEKITFKEIGDTVIYTDKNQQITMAHVMADLYENEMDSVKELLKFLPKITQETLQKLETALDQLGEEGSVLKEPYVNFYGLSGHGLKTLKANYPEINLPQKGVVYELRNNNTIKPFYADTDSMQIL